MTELLTAVASAFGIVFVAELGDKTQLLALGYGARHRLRTVAAGLAIGYGVASAVAAVVGGLLGAALPDRPIGLAAGALFLAFAVLAWRDIDGAESTPGGDDGAPPMFRRHVVASIALAIAVAELGDKTQIATAALAARSNPVATFVGATAGEVAAGLLGAVAGQRIGRRISARALQIASALLFALFGVALLVAAW
jgi:putative Ca2+/H+ antiporter (TMEM165/GDT1 family)